MRFPLALTSKIAAYIIGHKLRGTNKFATVLQLEPLHTCNLTCTGCGRIREYSTSMKDVMTLEDCLGAAQECNPPMVSICGGEPLIYPQIEALTHGLLVDQGRVVYLCTNAMFMRRKMRAYLTREFGRNPAAIEPKLAELLADGLVAEKDLAEIRKGPKNPDAPVMEPHAFFYWNVHLDGLEYTHDLIVEREGVFKEAVLGMRMAKALGYQVATNTTIYKETDMEEIEQMFDFLSDLGVDGHTISPGYEYDAAKQDMVKRLNLRGEDFFLTREGTREKFKDLLDWSSRYAILGTPVYHEFLVGKRELMCSAWAIPTRNIAGWRAPCYFMAGAGHYPTYAQMLSDVDWTKYGVDKDTGAPRDPRCENCMTQCGFEPSAAIGLNAERGDTWKNIKFNFGPRPKPTGRGHLVDAFNGVTSGRGHLTGAEARPRACSTPLEEPVAA
jgi:MoaA/NifB/PqqE/SkfB family radical SAM enzyme